MIKKNRSVFVVVVAVENTTVDERYFIPHFAYDGFFYLCGIFSHFAVDSYEIVYGKGIVIRGKITYKKSALIRI